MFIEQHAVDVYMEFNRNKIQLKKKMHIFTQELRTDTFFTWIPHHQLLNVKPLRTHRLSYHRFVGSINM